MNTRGFNQGFFNKDDTVIVLSVADGAGATDSIAKHTQLGLYDFPVTVAAVRPFRPTQLLTEHVVCGDWLTVRRGGNDPWATPEE